MDTGKTYYDSEGNECSIWQVVKREPEWAAVRIQEGERAIEENEQLKAQVNELLDQLQYIASQYSNCGCGHPACRRCQDQRENDEIIARIEKGLK